jgi:hypothetical protein
LDERLSHCEIVDPGETHVKVTVKTTMPWAR